MTREEFDSIDTWNDLYDIISDYNLQGIDCIYTDDERDTRIETTCREMLQYDSWTALHAYLDSLDTEYSAMWMYDDDGNWISLCDGDDLFQHWKVSVREELDYNGDFDDEEEELEPEPEPEPEPIMTLNFDAILDENDAPVPPPVEIVTTSPEPFQEVQTEDDDIEDLIAKHKTTSAGLNFDELKTALQALIVPERRTT